MATEVNLEQHAGNAKTIDISFKDDGVAVNITGATITWILAHGPGGTPILTKATGGTGITITNGAGGVARVTVAAADTALLAKARPRAYYHEAKCVEADGTPWTGVFGRYVILPASA